jgi:hypothetical protein
MSSLVEDRSLHHSNCCLSINKLGPHDSLQHCHSALLRFANMHNPRIATTSKIALTADRNNLTGL